MNWLSRDHCLCIGLGFAIGLTFYLAQASVGFDLWDEGFLWYGVRRVIAGEVPVRDFQAYDLGRYYWLAFWSILFGGNGLTGLRFGNALMQCIALSAILVSLRPLFRSWSILGLIGLCCSMWMAPPFLMSERAVAMFQVVWCLYVLRYRSLRIAFYSGAIGGILWLVGRNMALYWVCSLGVLGVYLGWQLQVSRERMFSVIKSFFSGLLIGIMPMLLVFLLVPNFFVVYWDTAVVNALFVKTTNLTVPVPWPWRVEWRLDSLIYIHRMAVSAALMLFITVFILCVVVVLRRGYDRDNYRNCFILAILFATFPWFHYAFSRADIFHIAPLGAPLIVLLICLGGVVGPSWRRVHLFEVVVVLSVLAPLILQPILWRCFINKEPLQYSNVGGSELVVNSYFNRLISNVGAVMNMFLRPGDSVLFVPYYPGLYAIFDRRSPIYESFPLFPSRPEKQLEAISDLKRNNTKLVLLWGHRVDNNPSLGFDRTHPMVMNYIRENYVHVRNVPGDDYQVFMKKMPESQTSIAADQNSVTDKGLIPRN